MLHTIFRGHWFFAAMLALAGHAAAQDGPRGIAFAIAPEQSDGMCIGEDPGQTAECAKAKCVDGGAMAEDCAPVAWCFPMGWSAQVSILHKEGISWSEYLCGWDSRKMVEAAAVIKCDPKLRSFIKECVVVQVWDNAGEPQM